MARQRGNNPGTGGTGTGNIDELKKQEEALTIAVQLLTLKIDQLAGGNQPFRNLAGMDGQGKSSEPKEKSAGIKDVQGAVNSATGGMMGLLVGKLIAVLAPVAILAAAISANTSGFSVFLSSAKLLGTVLGAMLLPVFLGLGAATYLLADYIENNLLNNIEEWYNVIIDDIIPALTDFVDWLDKAGKAVKQFIEDVRKESKEEREDLRKWLEQHAQKSEGGEVKDVGDIPVLGTFLRGWQALLNKGVKQPDELIPGFTKKQTKEEAFVGPQMPTDMELKGYNKTPSKDFVGPQMPTSRDKAVEGMRATIQEFKLALAPQAQRSGLVEAQKQAQMAALQTSPFQSKILDIVSKVYDAINKVDQHLPPPPTSH
jgi:hypothetical protein